MGNSNIHLNQGKLSAGDFPSLMENDALLTLSQSFLIAITIFYERTKNLSSPLPAFFQFSLSCLGFSPFMHHKIERQKIAVQISSNHDDIDAEIEPEHNQNNKGKTSVGICTIIVIHIDGKSPGKYTP